MASRSTSRASAQRAGSARGCSSATSPSPPAPTGTRRCAGERTTSCSRRFQISQRCKRRDGSFARTSAWGSPTSAGRPTGTRSCSRSRTAHSDRLDRKDGITLRVGEGSPRPRALTIAGSDSGGGAGIQADLKTFSAFGVYGMTAITAVTVQNTRGVAGYEELTPKTVADQIRAVATDIGVDAAKTGMLASSAIIDAVADVIEDIGIPNLVVDPVFVSKHGDRLLDEGAVGTLR